MQEIEEKVQNTPASGSVGRTRWIEVSAAAVVTLGWRLLLRLSFQPLRLHQRRKPVVSTYPQIPFPNPQKDAEEPTKGKLLSSHPDPSQSLYNFGLHPLLNSSSLSALSSASRTSISILSRARSTLLCK